MTAKRSTAVLEVSGVQRPEGVRTVTSLTPDHREASGWELRTAATTS
jgi:hypothetical protein